MENKFCENCHNSFNIYMDIKESKLYLYCKSCENKIDYTENRSLGNLDFYDSHGKTCFINSLNNEFLGSFGSLFPALLNPWQGKPANIKSTLPLYSKN